MGVNIKEAMVQSDDPANKAIVGHVVPRTVRMMMFTTTENAQWAADRIVKSVAYPLAQLTFIANRNMFRMEVGDQFRYSSTEYNITDMVFRIANITEYNLTKEHVKVQAIEDVEYMASIGSFSDIPVGNTPTGNKNVINMLEHILLIEAPYVLSGNDIMLIPLAARATGSELGFNLYWSTTGDSYTLAQQVTKFAVHGNLISAYPLSTSEIDDTVGFQVDIPNFASLIQSVTREQLFGQTNLSIIGNSNNNIEIITFQTITPVSGTIYEITGVYRNRFGSDKRYHYVGEDFWFVGPSAALVTNDEFTVGSTRYFKIVPYSATTVLSLAEANAYSITLVGTARMPYEPTNFGCNGVYVTPTYSGDCNLTWSPRVRGDGAGLGNPDYITEPPISWEGLFEVEVWVGGSKIRTQTGINALAWTYTSGMNSGDNGGLATTVVFKLRNYLTYEGVEYTSSFITITVNKE